jgi:hypothetical protein
MKRRNLGTRVSVAAALGMCVSTSASAELLRIPATNAGHIRDNGEHNDNYIVGRVGELEFRNFFVFDLSTIPADHVVVSASLIADHGWGGESATINYEPFPKLEVNFFNLPQGFGAAPAFEDIGVGTVFGRYRTSAPRYFAPEPPPGFNERRSYSIPLNNAALDAINGNPTGTFAVGGAVTRFDGAYYAYLWDQGWSKMPELWLHVVPKTDDGVPSASAQSVLIVQDFELMKADGTYFALDELEFEAEGGGSSKATLGSSSMYSGRMTSSSPLSVPAQCIGDCADPNLGRYFYLAPPVGESLSRADGFVSNFALRGVSTSTASADSRLREYEQSTSHGSTDRTVTFKLDSSQKLLISFAAHPYLWAHRSSNVGRQSSAISSIAFSIELSAVNSDGTETPVFVWDPDGTDEGPIGGEELNDPCSLNESVRVASAATSIYSPTVCGTHSAWTDTLQGGKEYRLRINQNTMTHASITRSAASLLEELTDSVGSAHIGSLLRCSLDAALKGAATQAASGRYALARASLASFILQVRTAQLLRLIPTGLATQWIADAHDALDELA